MMVAGHTQEQGGIGINKLLFYTFLREFGMSLLSEGGGGGAGGNGI